MMVRRMRADRERQAVTIHNRHDFHAFSALCRRHFGPAALSHREGRGDKAFFFIERSTFAKLVSDVGQNPNAEPRYGTTPGNDDAPFCSSDSIAAACAIARRY